jgi:DhnA family fructose-bisphosphate aldolase class Ia
MINGKFKVSEMAEQIGMISLYWVVPKAKEYLWKQKFPKIKRKVARSVKIAYCLEKYIVQYILVMEDKA